MLYIGCSGWSYEDWKGVFYPNEIKKAKMLDFYSGEFNLVEINSTFYRMPNKYAVLAWEKKVSKDFRFTAKIPKEITHKRLLKDSESIWREFYSLMHPLIQSEKLACFLIQLPPKFSTELVPNLREFLEFLPKSVNFCVEFRHESFDEDLSYLDILREQNVAYCIMDSPKMKPDVRTTADFAYLRFHGRNPRWTYNWLYSLDDLKEWMPKIEKVRKKTKNQYLFFNNHPKGKAIRNAREMKELLGISYKKAETPQEKLERWF
ncbi:MAG: DUF72 domain-containing protein [Candidatus Methanofastidiosia archaeon]